MGSDDTVVMERKPSQFSDSESGNALLLVIAALAIFAIVLPIYVEENAQSLSAMSDQRVRSDRRNLKNTVTTNIDCPAMLTKARQVCRGGNGQDEAVTESLIPVVDLDDEVLIYASDTDERNIFGAYRLRARCLRSEGSNAGGITVPPSVSAMIEAKCLSDESSGKCQFKNGNRGWFSLFSGSNCDGL